MLHQAILNDFPLSDDVKELQIIVLDFYKKLAELERNNKQYETENKLLRERVNQLIKHLYGRKSEKFPLYWDDNFRQSLLFTEPINPVDGIDQSEEKDNDNDNDKDKDIDEITIPEHKRKKPGRRPLPKEFPRITVVHDLSEEEKMCGCGCKKSCIGEDTSEQLEMQPARFRVVCHIRLKYACKNCQGVDKAEGDSTVNIAPAPVQLIPKSIATPSLLSHVFVSKFCDALPFYRQEGLFRRIGFDLTRATMCTWAMKISEEVKPLLELFCNNIHSGPLINIDETTLQVLHEPGRSFATKSYMWVFRGGAPDKPVIVYVYAETRSGDVAANFLGDYQGYVQTDGYGAYDFLDRREGITHVGCWAHVRRKFNEVVQCGIQLGDGGLAREALYKIRQLYRIEREAEVNGLDADELYIKRQEHSKPLLEEFEFWLRENAHKAPPKSLLGKAFAYTLSQWHRLIRYVLDGRLRMDNNLAENAIRPFVVGRKNWLFNDQPEGAAASATFYSLIETAKANGLEPYKYLCYLFDRLALAHSDEDLKTLLPQNLTPEFIDEHHARMFRWDG
jgi:transposase